MDALGRFRLRRELGTGPCAIVYEAHDGERPCALRVLKDEVLPADSGARAGLIMALAGLKATAHPSVVKVLDAGEEEGSIFVATELMGCPTLAQWMSEQSKLGEGQAVLFLRQAAQALDRMRDLGYCHGNLHPGNVFVVSAAKVKIADFAIDRLIEEPPDISVFEEQGALSGTADGAEWATAQELLSKKALLATEESLAADLTSLAALMLGMLGVDVPEREQDSDLNRYREQLRATVQNALTGSEAGVDVHTVDIVRRLLTPSSFTSPGEVVVELAGAMLLRHPRAPTPCLQESMRADEAGGTELEEERVEVRAMPMQDPEDELEPLEFRGDPRTAAFTPFFEWDNRRGGRFFVIYDGERLTIGRDPEVSDVTLMDPAASRRHCTVSKEGGVVRFDDLGSSNGTYLNDERVEGGEMTVGDCLRIGATRLFMSLTSR